MRTTCEHPILLVRTDAINHISTSAVYVKIEGQTKMFPIKSVEKHISLSARLHFPKYRQLIEATTEQDINYWHEVVEHIADTTFLVTANGDEIPLYFIAPCGKCDLCRNKRVADWKQRIFLESQAYSLPPLFVTITYDDDHNDGNLHKEHIQHFLKRLRINLLRDKIPFDRAFLYNYQKEQQWNSPNYIANDDDPKTSIRYILCGEYGSHTKRPHYHLLIWNYPIVRDYLDCIDRTQTLDYVKSHIVDAWQHGDFGSLYLDSNGKHGKNLDIQFANNAGSYILKYMMKDTVAPQGKTPEFQSKSLGLGYWFETYQLREMVKHFTEYDNISSCKVQNYFDVTTKDVYAYRSFADRYLNLSQEDKFLKQDIEYVLCEIALRRNLLQHLIDSAKKTTCQIIPPNELSSMKFQEYILNIWQNRILETFQPYFSEIYHFTVKDDASCSISVSDAMQSIELWVVGTKYERIFEMCHNKSYIELVLSRVMLKNRKLKNRLQAEEKDLQSMIKKLSQRKAEQQSKEIF